VLMLHYGVDGQDNEEKIKVTCNITKRNNEGNIKRLVVKCLKVTISCISFPYLMLYQLG
jgi:hypothetical protein